MATRSASSSTPTLPAVPGAPLGTFVLLNLGPLWLRILRREGALLAVNAALVFALRPPLIDTLGYLVLSTLVLSAAYAVNDWKDCEADRRNPKKNQRLVEALVQSQRAFGLWLIALHAALVSAAWLWLGRPSALAVVVMLAVNAAYSQWLKGMPVVDVIIVGVWGAAYTAIVPASWRVYLFIGVMTALMHVFQIQGDRDVDAANRVSTSVVRLPRIVVPIMFAVCGILLAWGLSGPLGPVWAATGFLPLALRLVIRHTETAWTACRLYCGVALVALLSSLHGWI